MSEPWLRERNDAWIPSPQAQGVYNLHVSDLMIPNLKLWDKNKIESLFPLHIANRIMETPLLSVVEEDKIIWGDSMDGNYSVKSGYKVLMQIQREEASTVQHVNWLSLWKIHAPPKAKHLLWRICRGCLPTRVRLQEKHVPCELSCPLCDHAFEDDWHTFVTCNTSVQARHAAGLDSILATHIHQAATIQDLILNVCMTEPTERAGVFAVMLWVLWQNRNNMVWNAMQENGRHLGMKALHLWNEWNDVQWVQHGQRRTPQHQQLLRWEKPQHGWFKCNIDAGFYRDLNTTTTGWCLRDHMGRFILAGTTRLDGNYSVIEGEATALLEAMKELKQRRISNVIFETDAKSVVDAIQFLHGGNSEFSLLVAHINNFLCSDQNFVVKFIKRQANMVAHSLARAAISWTSRCTFGNLPTCISFLLINEMV
jgi:ribonuclease HI